MCVIEHPLWLQYDQASEHADDQALEHQALEHAVKRVKSESPPADDGPRKRSRLTRTAAPAPEVNNDASSPVFAQAVDTPDITTVFSQLQAVYVHDDDEAAAAADAAQEGFFDGSDQVSTLDASAATTLLREEAEWLFLIEKLEYLKKEAEKVEASKCM